MVRQLDVFPHPEKSSRTRYPYVVILQHDSVYAWGETTIVAPLVPIDRTLTSRLYPIIEVNGRQLMLLTPVLSRMPLRLLRRRAAHVAESRSRIIAAIDLLFAGS